MYTAWLKVDDVFGVLGYELFWFCALDLCLATGGMGDGFLNQMILTFLFAATVYVCVLFSFCKLICASS